ncbi:MAG: 6-pyruvoyl-tetrahydropterin synthase [Psychromonas sp.]|jgi:6-pyruvoyl-tetrahydropterin synthase|uniref:6-carboxytetrahydropterin synthase n=1 Tax=Psychromonas sp. TaxID=1884585 RepID=UPI0039E3A5F1
MKLFVRDLTVIDASYLDANRGFVGESYLVDVVLTGLLDNQSMILDFSLVKKQIKTIIDAEVDHKLLVPRSADNCTVTVDDKRTEVNFELNDSSVIQLNCPNQAYCVLDSTSVSVNVLEAYLTQVILPQLPENVQELEIKLRNENISTPFYHYTHGLKKHNGNCQRIAHGHRSKIDVFIDNKYSEQWVAEWAQRWQDIYLISAEDVIKKSELSFLAVGKNGTEICTAYNAPQGYFELLMPIGRSETLPNDTTVESLSEFICGQIKARVGDKKVTVYAYEGVGKGAISER